jgi:molybdate transport system substrate-binding protein
MPDLMILSGGAAQGLVARLTAAFRDRTGCGISGTFGAVGLMAARLRENAPADVVILTDALVEVLSIEGRLQRSPRARLGNVPTSVAVRTGDPAVQVGDGEALKAALLAADAIFVPDMVQSTAGQHVAAVLGRLGISAEVASRLKVFPNGATAMRELAASKAQRPIGCTQATEILNTPGVTLTGDLPAGFDLSTIYTAAVTTKAVQPDAARTLVKMLADPAHGKLRQELGFAPG